MASYKAIGNSAASRQTYCLRHSGEDRITTAKQHNGLPHRSEKQQYECHGQQHIDARGGEETCDNVTLKDSLDVYGPHSAFLRGLGGEDTVSPLRQREATPLLAAPALSFGNCRANRAPATSDRKPKANWRLNGYWKISHDALLSCSGGGGRRDLGVLFSAQKPDTSPPSATSRETCTSQRAEDDRVTRRRLKVLVIRFTGKVLSHNVAVRAQHSPAGSVSSVKPVGQSEQEEQKSCEDLSTEGNNCFLARPRLEFLLSLGQSSLCCWRWFVPWETERPCGGRGRWKPTVGKKTKHNSLHPRLVSLLLSGRPL